MNFLLSLLLGQTSIDWLFWAWAAVTVLLFIDILVPDPIPFIDEIILAIAFFILLGMLAIRASILGIKAIMGYVFHPAVIAFVIVFALLYFAGKIKFKKRGGRK